MAKQKASVLTVESVTSSDEDSLLDRFNALRINPDAAHSGAVRAAGAQYRVTAPVSQSSNATRLKPDATPTPSRTSKSKPPSMTRSQPVSATAESVSCAPGRRKRSDIANDHPSPAPSASTTSGTRAKSAPPVQSVVCRGTKVNDQPCTRSTKERVTYWYCHTHKVQILSLERMRSPKFEEWIYFSSQSFIANMPKKSSPMCLAI